MIFLITTQNAGSLCVWPPCAGMHSLQHPEISNIDLELHCDDYVFPLFFERRTYFMSASCEAKSTEKETDVNI